MTNSTVAFLWSLLFVVGSAQASDDKIGVVSLRPSVSPSEGEVIFAANFDGAGHLWACGLDGSNLRRVLPTFNGVVSTAEDEPAWSPDGQQVAFTSHAEDGSIDIWVMRPDGAYPVRLTAASGRNRNPAWSPDSSTIVFVSDKDGTKDIWLMNRDGTGKRKLVTSAAQEQDPAFSPAGDRIVFVQTENGASNLRTVSVNGIGLAKVTSGPGRDWEPFWGPQGIVFVTNREAADQWKLWKVQPDGSGLQKIGDVAAHDPVVLRDGRILFADQNPGSKAISSLSILDPRTGAKRPVVDVQGFLTPIDIRPGKAPNRVNPRSRGKIEVAILSTPEFDASKSVVQTTLTFGATGAERTLQDCRKDLRDVNRDGRPDLVCRFSLRDAGFQQGSVTGILRFDDTKGTPYEGRDAVVIVADDDPDDLKD